MKINFEVPDAVWFQIASEAEKRNVKSGQVIVNAIEWALQERLPEAVAVRLAGVRAARNETELALAGPEVREVEA